MATEEFKGVEAHGGWARRKKGSPGDYHRLKRDPDARPKRRVLPHERLPMYHVATVDGDEQVDLFRDREGNFQVHTRDNVYDLKDIVGGNVTININHLQALNMLAKADLLPPYATAQVSLAVRELERGSTLSKGYIITPDQLEHRRVPGVGETPAPPARLPLHYAEAGGDRLAYIVERPDGSFVVQTRDKEVPFKTEPPDVHVHIDLGNVVREVDRLARIAATSARKLENDMDYSGLVTSPVPAADQGRRVLEEPEPRRAKQSRRPPGVPMGGNAQAEQPLYILRTGNNPLGKQDEKTYLQPGEKPPRGEAVQHGPRGGRYYEGAPRQGQPSMSASDIGALLRGTKQAQFKVPDPRAWLDEMQARHDRRWSRQFPAAVSSEYGFQAWKLPTKKLQEREFNESMMLIGQRDAMRDHNLAATGIRNPGAVKQTLISYSEYAPSHMQGKHSALTSLTADDWARLNRLSRTYLAERGVAKLYRGAGPRSAGFDKRGWLSYSSSFDTAAIFGKVQELDLATFNGPIISMRALDLGQEYEQEVIVAAPNTVKKGLTRDRRVQKQGFTHEHDGYPRHPIGVKHMRELEEGGQLPARKSRAPEGFGDDKSTFEKSGEKQGSGLTVGQVTKLLKSGVLGNAAVCASCGLSLTTPPFAERMYTLGELTLSLQPTCERCGARDTLAGLDENKLKLATLAVLRRPRVAHMLKTWGSQLYLSVLAKDRVYLKPGEQAPKGMGVKRGKRGGRYYESAKRSGPQPQAMVHGTPIRNLDAILRVGLLKDEGASNFSISKPGRVYLSKDDEGGRNLCLVVAAAAACTHGDKKFALLKIRLALGETLQPDPSSSGLGMMVEHDIPAKAVIGYELYSVDPELQDAYNDAIRARDALCEYDPNYCGDNVWVAEFVANVYDEFFGRAPIRTVDLRSKKAAAVGYVAPATMETIGSLIVALEERGIAPVEKAVKPFTHEHDGFPRHPVGVKDHEAYFHQHPELGGAEPLDRDVADDKKLEGRLDAVRNGQVEGLRIVVDPLSVKNEAVWVLPDGSGLTGDGTPHTDLADAIFRDDIDEIGVGIYTKATLRGWIRQDIMRSHAIVDAWKRTPELEAYLQHLDQAMDEYCEPGATAYVQLRDPVKLSYLYRHGRWEEPRYEPQLENALEAKQSGEAREGDDAKPHEECEKKFLVDRDKLPDLPQPWLVVQGYLDENTSLRLIPARGRAYLRDKHPGIGMCREKRSRRIDFRQALDDITHAPRVAVKARYLLRDETGRAWLVDHMLTGRDQWSAESEFATETEARALDMTPVWVGEDVTDRPQDYTVAHAVPLSPGKLRQALRWARKHGSTAAYEPAEVEERNEEFQWAPTTQTDINDNITEAFSHQHDGLPHHPVNVQDHADLAKADRTYLAPGEKPPGGVDIKRGPRGGRYYEGGGKTVERGGRTFEVEGRPSYAPSLFIVHTGGQSYYIRPPADRRELTRELDRLAQEEVPWREAKQAEQGRQQAEQQAYEEHKRGLLKPGAGVFKPERLSLRELDRQFGIWSPKQAQLVGDGVVSRNRALQEALEPTVASQFEFSERQVPAAELQEYYNVVQWDLGHRFPGLERIRLYRGLRAGKPGGYKTAVISYTTSPQVAAKYAEDADVGIYEVPVAAVVATYHTAEPLRRPQEVDVDGDEAEVWGGNEREYRVMPGVARDLGSAESVQGWPALGTLIGQRRLAQVSKAGDRTYLTPGERPPAGMGVKRGKVEKRLPGKNEKVTGVIKAKVKPFTHEHDGWPRHPVAVKDHQAYFSRHDVQALPAGTWTTGTGATFTVGQPATEPVQKPSMGDVPLSQLIDNPGWGATPSSEAQSYKELFGPNFLGLQQLGKYADNIKNAWQKLPLEHFKGVDEIRLERGQPDELAHYTRSVRRITLDFAGRELAPAVERQTAVHEVGHAVYDGLWRPTGAGHQRAQSDELALQIIHDSDEAYYATAARVNSQMIIEVTTGELTPGANMLAQQSGAVTAYALTNSHEWFAESYSFYVVYPNVLKRINPTMYSIMRKVFGEKEY